jgi:hypothetical protein
MVAQGATVRASSMPSTCPRRSLGELLKQAEAKPSRPHGARLMSTPSGEQVIDAGGQAQERRLNPISVFGHRVAEEEAQVGGPAVELRVALARDAEQLADDSRRIRVGERCHELARAARSKVVDELVSHGTHHRAQGVDRAWRECLAHEAAQG